MRRAAGAFAAPQSDRSARYADSGGAGSDAALAVLDEACEIADPSGLVFPSVTGRPMSDSTLSKLLRENGVAAVPHGFRSSFRDWAAECTPFAREVMEAALAHRTTAAVEAAYLRSDLLERRRTDAALGESHLMTEAGKQVCHRPSVPGSGGRCPAGAEGEQRPPRVACAERRADHPERITRPSCDAMVKPL